MIAIALAIALLQSVVQGQTVVTVRVGDTANFTLNQPNNCACSRNQQTITINGRYGLVTNNDGTANLTISQVTKDDFGLYNCVWNSDINTMIQFSLVVVEPILMDVNQVVYNLNDNVTLTCRVTFYMKSNLMLTADQDLALFMMLNGRVLIKDNTTYSTVTDVRKRYLTYSGNAVEDMRTYNVTCLLKSNYFSESTSQRVYITTLPKAAKIANKTDIFYPGQTLVCTVDSYPLLPVSWNKLSAPSCQNPPSSMPQGLGMATLTLTSKCLGQQTWSCTATWIDLVTVVNDTITFTVSVNSTGESQELLDAEEKRKRDIGLGVGLGLGIPLLILIIALIYFCCFGSRRGESTKKSDPTKFPQAVPKKATAPVTNPNPNPNFHALPSYNQVSKSGNGVNRGAPGVPDIGVAHLNGSGSIPQLNSSLDGQINFRTGSGAVNLGRADLGVQNRSFTNI